MDGPLVLHPTSTAQWYALVQEAEAARGLDLGEELQSYLVFLLMRFTDEPQMVKSILALDFLKGVESSGSQQRAVFKDVGDKCLLFSGLFPGQAEKRQVQISYFVELGQNAYNAASPSPRFDLSELFTALCHGFVNLMDVLQSMRELDGSSKSLNALEAIHLWADTGSQHAFDTLQDVTTGTPIIPDNEIKH